MQLIKKSALFALVLSSALICGQQVQAAKPSAAPAQETTLEVKAKLDAFAKSYVARANDTLKNNRQNMSVTKQGTHRFICKSEKAIAITSFPISYLNGN